MQQSSSSSSSCNALAPFAPSQVPTPNPLRTPTVRGHAAIDVDPDREEVAHLLTTIAEQHLAPAHGPSALREPAASIHVQQLASPQVDSAMHLRCADGILVLLGRTRSLLATRALMPLVSSRGDAGTIVVDAPSAALLPVLRFLALCGEDGVLPVGTWTQVARCVRSIEALSSAAALAARCRLPTLADRLLRWRSLASHWTCPAQRFTIDLVLARSSASSADSLVITAHAAAATVDSFVQLAQQIGKADAERLALQSIESRRRDPAQRTVMLPLARFEASSVLYCAADRPPDAASRAASPFAGSLSPLAPVDTAHSSLAVWCAYIDTTRQAGSVTCPAIFPSGMLERARAAIATTEPLQTRADLAAALDRYERLCAHGACQPDNAFHLHAVLLASGRTCAAAAAVLHDAVARSPAALCRLLDAEAKLAPYVAHPRHQDNRAAPAAPSPRIRIESLLADLVVARLGGHFACDVGARIEQALRKYYSGALTLN